MLINNMQPPRFGPTNLANFHDITDDVDNQSDNDSKNMGLIKKQHFKWKMGNHCNQKNFISTEDAAQTLETNKMRIQSMLASTRKTQINKFKEVMSDIVHHDV